MARKMGERFENLRPSNSETNALLPTTSKAFRQAACIRHIELGRPGWISTG
jgi:hypothetical protein